MIPPLMMVKIHGPGTVTITDTIPPLLDLCLLSTKTSGHGTS